MNPKVICFDIDDTISFTTNRDYSNAVPCIEIINRMKDLKYMGYKIVLQTARGMGRSENKFWTVADEVIPELIEWLRKNEVPYDEIRFEKPWACLYVDDKAITPEKFLELPLEAFV